MCNTNWLSTATMVARTLLNVAQTYVVLLVITETQCVYWAVRTVQSYLWLGLVFKGLRNGNTCLVWARVCTLWWRNKCKYLYQVLKSWPSACCLRIHKYSPLGSMYIEPDCGVTFVSRWGAAYITVCFVSGSECRECCECCMSTWANERVDTSAGRFPQHQNINGNVGLRLCLYSQMWNS
jgi:hypothetical protein